jgi:hypothetical protein
LLKLDRAGPQLTRNGLKAEHFTGAANECAAAQIFLHKGHQVYWPSAAQSHVDFVADIDGDLTRVQVKTGTWSKAGKYSYLQTRLLQSGVKKSDKPFIPAEMYDIVVVVADVGVWIIPANKIDTTNLCLSSTGPRRNRRWDSYRI